MRRRAVRGWLSEIGFPVMVTQACPAGKILLVDRSGVVGVMETTTATRGTIRPGRLDATEVSGMKGKGGHKGTKGGKGGKGTKSKPSC